MSAKSALFEILNSFPTTMTDAVFPTLSVPASPSTVEEAIIASSKANIEIVKFLDAFKTIKVKELFGSVGTLNPSSQAIAAGFLQADGTPLSGGTLEGAIKLIGDEASGGGLTGYIESPERRDSSGSNLTLIDEMASLVPALATWTPYLTPLANLAIWAYQRPGRIGEQVGLILFQEVASLIRQIIFRSLFEDGEDSHCDDTALRKMADKMGIMAEKLDLGLMGFYNEELEQYEPWLQKIKEVMEEYLATEGIVEIDGTRVWCRSKVVDGR